jgi:hypothetical protein
VDETELVVAGSDASASDLRPLLRAMVGGATKSRTCGPTMPLCEKDPFFLENRGIKSLFPFVSQIDLQEIRILTHGNIIHGWPIITFDHQNRASQPAMEKLWFHPTLPERLWLDRGEVGFGRAACRALTTPRQRT